MKFKAFFSFAGRLNPDRRRTITIFIGLLFIFFGLCLWFYLTLPEPRIRTIFKGDAELIRFTVANAAIAGFRVGRTKALPDNADDGVCVDGLIRPAQGAEVTYLRIDKGPVTIDVALPKSAIGDTRPTAFVEGVDGQEFPLAGPHRLIEVDESVCPGLPPTRLSIQGDATFGRELSPANRKRDFARGHLFQGNLVMFGQSVDRLFGFWHVRSRIYKTEEIPMPAGSRVSAKPTTVGGEQPVWWGVVRVASDQRGLSFEASTNARRIILVMPGSEPNSDVIEAGNFFQLTEDPNVFWFFVMLTAATTGLLSAVAAGAWEQVGRWFREL